MEVNTQKEEDILETQGLWRASSFIKKYAERSARKKQPIRISPILNAHKLVFQKTKLNSIGGRYRREGEQNHLERIDGSLLYFPSWEKIPERMALLDRNLVYLTKDIEAPTDEKSFENLVSSSARIVHQFVCIHPFVNGNGRTSRLLLDAILMRAGLRKIVNVGKKKYRTAMYEADKGNLNQLEETIEEGILGAEKMILGQRLIAQGVEKKKAQ